MINFWYDLRHTKWNIYAHYLILDIIIKLKKEDEKRINKM